MRPNLQYFEEKFDYYNNLCFGGQLPRPLIKLSQRNSRVGCTHIGFRYRNGKWEKDISLEFSIRNDFPEIEYIDTIVHEMIHYYIEWNNIQDDSPHGTKFRSIMKEITEKYGIRITIEYDEAEEALIARQTDRNRYVCVVEDKDGTTSIAVVIRDKVFQYWELLQQHPDVAQAKWYISNRAIFEHFPARIRPAFVKLDAAKIQHYLFGALELENTGEVIKPIGQEYAEE